MRRRRALLSAARNTAFAVCALPWIAVGPVAAASLAIEVVGVKDEMRENVLARLDVAARKRQGLTEAEIRQLHTDAEREIQTALQPFGYYHPYVTSELDHRGARWHARYVIDPGPPVRIDSLDVRVANQGADDPAFRNLVATLPLRRGDVLVHSTYESVKDAFTRAALKTGYLDGQFTRSTIGVDLDRNTAAVTLHYDTGPAYQFGPVEFRQDVVNPAVLQGYVRFHRGEPLDFNRLLELEQALGNSPYFSRVEVRARRDLAQGTELPIVVDLVPAKPGKYTLGAGYGTDDGAHVRALAELRRLNRRGHRGEVDGTLSGIEQSAAAKYQIPWPYPRTDVLTFSTGYTIQKVEATEERTGLIGANLSRLWAGWQYAFGIQFRRQKFAVGVDQGLSNFLVPEASWSRLRTDDPIDPGNGRRLEFRLAGAHSKLFSDASYLRLEAHGRWIRTFSRRHRLIGRAESGYTWTHTFHELPPSARFFAGGAQSVRGFGFNSLGPRDRAGFVSGGEALLAGSFEYEYRFGPHWGIAAFSDAGNAMHSFREPLEYAAGFGGRWVSPVGLVRLDLGFPLSRTPHRPEVHISIGPAL